MSQGQEGIDRSFAQRNMVIKGHVKIDIEGVNVCVV